MPLERDTRRSGPPLAAWAVLCAVVLAVTAVDQWRALSRTCTGGRCVPLQLRPPALARSVIGLPAYALGVTAFSVVFGICLFGLAYLVARHGRGVAVPVVFLAMGATVGTTFVPGGWFGAVRQGLSWVALAGLFWLLATFPTARFVPRWTAVPTAVAAVWAGTTTLVPPVADAIAADEGAWAAAEGPVFAAALLLIVAGQVVRYRWGTATERRQVGLVLVAVAVFAAVSAGGSVSALDGAGGGVGTLRGTGWQLAGMAALALVMASIAVALVRHQAFGVTTVVRGTLVVALVTIAATVVYGLVVAAVSVLAEGRVPVVLGAVAAALVLGPARDRAARGVDRLLHGDAADPSLLVAALDRRLREASAAVSPLSVMTETLAERLRLPRVTVTLSDGTAVTAGPVPDAPLGDAVPLRLGADPLGEVGYALRPGQRRVSARDRAAFEAAGGPLAAAAIAVRLTVDVRRSRTALVAAREEERRALRAQVHDEFGPTLASLRHRVNAARRDLRRAAEAADERLVEADSILSDLMKDVRALARDLRPPDLDEFGLPGAVERFAEGLTTPALVLADLDRPLPAAVEVTAYRILLEALLNAEHHGCAAGITVRLVTGPGRLRIEVADDGAGPPPRWTAGVGMTSMRERAAELGGTLVFGPADGGGALLACELPWEDG